MIELQHSHDELVGFLLETLHHYRWIFTVEDLLNDGTFSDVLARPPGRSYDVLFEVKSHIERNQMGGAIRQVRRYAKALPGRVHPRAFIYTDQVLPWGASLMLAHANVGVVRHWLSRGAGGIATPNGETTFLFRVEKETSNAKPIVSTPTSAPADVDYSTDEDDDEPPPY